MNAGNASCSAILVGSRAMPLCPPCVRHPTHSQPSPHWHVPVASLQPGRTISLQKKDEGERVGASSSLLPLGLSATGEDIAAAVDIVAAETGGAMSSLGCDSVGVGVALSRKERCSTAGVEETEDWRQGLATSRGDAFSTVESRLAWKGSCAGLGDA